MNFFQTIRLTCHRLNAACLADRYIDERYDHPPYFLPRNDPAKRAHVRIWSDFVTEKMQKNLGCIRLHRGRNGCLFSWKPNGGEINTISCGFFVDYVVVAHSMIALRAKRVDFTKISSFTSALSGISTCCWWTKIQQPKQRQRKPSFRNKWVDLFLQPFIQVFHVVPKCSGKVSGESLRSTLNPIGFKLDHFAALVYCELLPRSVEPFPRPWARSDCFNWLRWKQRIWRCVARSDTSRTNIILICKKSCQSHAFFSPFLEHVACSNHIFKHGHLSLQDGPYFLGKEISMVDIALFPFWQRFLWVGSYYRGWLTRT